MNKYPIYSYYLHILYYKMMTKRYPMLRYFLTQ